MSNFDERFNNNKYYWNNVGVNFFVHNFPNVSESFYVKKKFEKSYNLFNKL